MKTLTVTAVLFSVAFAMGCSSSETQNPVPSTGTPAGTATPAPSDTPPADPAPVDTAPAVKPPTIQEIMKMAGALHVS